jgi:hypothetical protein
MLRLCYPSGDTHSGRIGVLAWTLLSVLAVSFAFAALITWVVPSV